MTTGRQKVCLYLTIALFILGLHSCTRVLLERAVEGVHEGLEVVEGRGEDVVLALELHGVPGQVHARGLLHELLDPCQHLVVPLWVRRVVKHPNICVQHLVNFKPLIIDLSNSRQNGI